MDIKLRFSKTMEIPDEIILPQRVSLQVLNEEQKLERWIFVKITNTDYEFDHVE